MPEPLVLQGHSVRLVPLSLEHVEALVTAANGSRATYRFTWVPDDHPSMRTYVALAQSEQQAGRELPFTTCDASTGQVVGSTRFLDLEYWNGDDNPPTACEIGATWLAASAQRTSINTEAKLLMLGHAFDVWQVHRVVFKTDARNSRSRAAIERIGGQFEGIRRAHKLASDGTIRDSAYFSILRSDWPEVNDHLTAMLVARLPAPS
jgi:RimJ/RimL family protein N-acetyltransferase